ncbi:hypothetical protein GQ457_12G013590 [Hibiscus cannabinus]
MCIALNQSAFVLGRIISDNVLIAHELMHYLKGSKNGPNKGSAIKLDMEKAYDRVERHFLAAMMSKLGFDDRWIGLVMKCVTSVSYCIRMNGIVSDFFSPSRGLRQGDPLSPFLFLFCTQGLSAMLLKEQAEGRIKGVRASQAGPRVNHLLYADDCILFIKNAPSEAMRVLEVLSDYEKASGQKVNKDKSAIYFSNGMTTESKRNIQDILCMREEEDLGTYLGIPLIVGKNKTNALGREVLIKAVAQALPAYAMMCFLLPDCIIDPLVSTIRNFWWSGKAKERGWAIVAWEKLCRPKAMGGMGFRNLKEFNVALLGKQVWRLYKERDTLCYKVLSAKYFRDGNIFDAELKERSSFIWSAIYKAKEALKKGYYWRVGRDSEAKMLQDNWGGEKPVRLEGSYMDSPTNPIRCKEFMETGTMSWDARKLAQVFESADVKQILECPIANSSVDRMIWCHQSSGVYTTRSGHNWLIKRGSENREENPIWKVFAKLPVLPKIRIFGWRLGREALPVGQNVRAAYLGDGTCKLCGTRVETVLHVVRECSTVQDVLRESGLEKLLPQGPFCSCLEWLESCSTVLNREQFTFLIVLSWNVWNRRNRWVHNNQLIPASQARTTKWTKPPEGQIKINVDGAWSAATRIATVGVIARDHHGLMIDGCAQRVEGSHTADTIEAVAFARGVSMAVSHGWENVVIEGDAMGIVNRLNAMELDDSVAASYLAETWMTLRRCDGLSVQYVN